MTQPSTRALRVGLLLGDNLVEERVFADAAPITVGQSLRCRISVPVDGVPYEHALFVRDQGRLMLRVTKPMAGRLAQGGTIVTELQAGAGHDGVWLIPLERGARGKIAIGEATILFQEVAAPVRVPRPMLPASVRGTFADRIDRRLAVIVGSSLLVHLAIGTWAWVNETDEVAMFQSKQAVQYRQDVYAITLPDELPGPVIDPTEPGAATPVAPVQTPAPIVAPTRITSHPGTPRVPTVGDADRFAQILTGNDETRGGPGEMSNRQPGADLDQQLDDIKHNHRIVKVGDEDGGFRNRPREGLGDGQRQPENTMPTRLDQQRPRDEAVQPRIVLRPTKKLPPDNRLTPEILIAKIQHDYMTGLMRCYQKGLVGDSTLAGKVAVSFTVAESGKLEDPSARGVSPDVDACISTQMATWRFPQPRTDDGGLEALDFALSFALVSGN